MKDKNIVFDCFTAVSLFNKQIAELNGPSTPAMLTTEMEELRTKLLKEELQEYIDADNIPDKFDALIDLVYVAMGTAHLMGLPFNSGFIEVHQANMRKVRASTADESKRNSKFDVIKPPGWVPPNLTRLIW